MRFRVTLRGRDVELRGYVDGSPALTALSEALEPQQIMVVASPTDDDYNPFTAAVHLPSA